MADENHSEGGGRDDASRSESKIEKHLFDQPVPFLIVDDFLALDELSALLEYALNHERNFRASGVIDPAEGTSVVNRGFRRSLSLADLQMHREVITSRIASSFPRVLEQLGREPFAYQYIEALLVATNDGEFFKRHNDNASEDVRTREITFTYYFHREPKAFADGELRIYTSFVRALLTGAAMRFETIAPLQNRIVFFPSCMFHEVRPVRCPSRAFADSRFSVSGWIHK